MSKKIYSKCQLIFLLREWVKNNGKVPTKVQLNADKTMPSERPYLTTFGSWTNALKESGIELPKKIISQKQKESIIKAHKGKRSFAWKGGKRINNQGYIEVYRPDHPNANKKGYILEHRLVLSETLGRSLRKDEDGHHKNHVKTDNRPENLEVITKSNHSKLHERDNKEKHKRKNSKKCLYPNCTKLTSGRYGLCRNHYKLQWSRMNKGLINNFMVFTEIKRNQREDTKEKLREYAKKQNRSKGRFI